MQRKVRVIRAINAGIISLKEASNLYNLAEEEFRSWEHALQQYGLDGLRVTKLQCYRGQVGKEKAIPPRMYAPVSGKVIFRNVARLRKQLGLSCTETARFVPRRKPGQRDSRAASEVIRNLRKRPFVKMSTLKRYARALGVEPEQLCAALPAE